MVSSLWDRLSEYSKTKNLNSKVPSKSEQIHTDINFNDI